MIHEKNHLTKATGRLANGNSPTAMFEKVLRAFETGGLTFSDLQLTLKQQLTDGASPDDLLKIMRRRELIEPLPDYAQQEILAIIQAERDARSGNGAAPANADPSSASRTAPGRAAADADPDEPAMSRLLQALAVDWDPEPGKGSAVFAGNTALTAEIKTMRTALEQRDEDLTALRNEHARVLGLLETRARSAAQLESDLRARDAELEALQNELQQQQLNARELSEALAVKKADEAARERAEDATALQEAIAAREAALLEARRSLEEREAALHQARRSLDERDSALEQARYSLTEHDAALDQARQLLSQRDDALDQARNSLIEREDALEQARRMLSERDAQIALLQEQHAAAAPALELRAQSTAKLHAELQAALERGAALEADLITAHAALGAEQTKSRRMDGVLTEKNALSAKVASLRRSLDERSAELAAQKQELSKIASVAAARTKALETELKEARERIDALSATAQAVEPVAATVPVAVKPTVEVAEFVPPPAQAKPRAKAADIEEFALSPPINWLRHKLVRTLGMCGVMVAVVVGIWSIAHRGSEAKVPEVAAAPLPLPLPGTVIHDCEACPALTVLPAGRFKQGSAEGSSSGFVKPMHWVAIEHPFAMSTNDVTVAEFRAFATATGRNMQGCDVYDGQWKHQQNNSWQNPGFEQAANHPVTCASWNDAKAYAQWLSAQTGHQYRLPSASEWEYAARAGANAAQPWGGNSADACLNANVADTSAARRFPGWVAFGCNDGYIYTSPVGTFKASAFGLHDMLGNVFQWTEDCWNANYIHAPIDGSARTDGNCAEHELRGGSWFSSPEYVRADYRNHFAADYRASSVGIRLVRDIAS